MIEYFYDGLMIYLILITLQMIRHYFCIQYADLFHEYALFLNLHFYYGTSMLVGIIQIVNQQML